MSVAQARALLPKDAIIGVSCNNLQHVKKAVEDGVEYIGIGAVWGTRTKVLTNPIIGVRGVGVMLEALDGSSVKAVAIGMFSCAGSEVTSSRIALMTIGGIKAGNLLRTLYGSVSSTGRALDGVAVVSEIVASQNPKQATEKLSRIFKAFKVEFALTPARGWTLPSSLYGQELATPTTDAILEGVGKLMVKVREISPLVHQVCIRLRVLQRGMLSRDLLH